MSCTQALQISHTLAFQHSHPGKVETDQPQGIYASGRAPAGTRSHEFMRLKNARARTYCQRKKKSGAAVGVIDIMHAVKARHPNGFLHSVRPLPLHLWRPGRV